MSKPRLKFGDGVPGWLRQIASRWVNRIVPADWTITLMMSDTKSLEKNLGDGTRGASRAFPEQLDAAIWMADTVLNTEETERIVLHEIRHAHYWAISQVFSQAWGSRKMNREHAEKLLDDKIEELIERDVNLFLRAWRR